MDGWRRTRRHPVLHQRCAHGMLSGMMRKTGFVRGLLAGMALVMAAAAPARGVCPGDCDGSADVTVSELVRGVNIALGALPLSACSAFDRDADGQVAVSELVAAVNAALNGCPPEGTPTASAAPTPTATLGLEPIFPADYRETFTEVRDCRLAIEHGGVMIRVLANDVAAEPYRREQNPLPVGSIVIKEEYDGVDCSNEAELFRWTAMRKEAPGFDPEDADWNWQRVDAPSRGVTCSTKDCPGFPCVGCHRAPACVARDYMCTEDGSPPRGRLEPVLENVPAALLSIAGRSATDVYAVGSDPRDGRGAYVVHYDGTGWRRLDTGSTGDLWWISVTPIGGHFFLVGAGGLILQLDPDTGSFTRHTPPAVDGGTAGITLFGVWGAAADNLWAVGEDAAHHAVIWHYDGDAWTPRDISGQLPSGEEPTTLYKVWGRAANDVYAVGARGTILHYDGTTWSAVTSPVTRSLFTVHGAESLVATVGGFSANGVILERREDGSFASRTPASTPQMNGVFAAGPTDVVAVGNELAVAVRDASGWALVSEGDAGIRDFHAVWIDPQDGIWAVGGDLSALNAGVLAYGGPQPVVGGPVE